MEIRARANDRSPAGATMRPARPEGPGQRRLSANGRRHSTTREMVLRMIEAQSAPVSTAALSTATGLHENTVRGHLEQLFIDGYIGRQREPASGRGRPAWLWVAARPDPENPYAALAGVLADTLAHTAEDPIAQAREAGRRWGSEIAARRAPLSAAGADASAGGTDAAAGGTDAAAGAPLPR
ncbi:hypothetical protein [Microbacterium protaetiae]|uniref:hypothetical protein n=1 Tax=Microbacterium protaetiae TaxID=2509458 RepID=UPI0013EDE73A|nr:hypothetical protein [Microbacterium protaetiae]